MAFIVCFSALPSIHLLLLHCVDNFDAVSLFCYVCFVLVNCCSSRSSIGIVHSVRNLSRSLFVMALTASQRLTSSHDFITEDIEKADGKRRFDAQVCYFDSSVWEGADKVHEPVQALMIGQGLPKKVLSLLFLFWCQHKEAYIHHMCMFEYQPSTLLKICDQKSCKILRIITKSSMVSTDIMKTSSMWHAHNVKTTWNSRISNVIYAQKHQTIVKTTVNLTICISPQRRDSLF